ncbi:MAG: gliding motility-associated C-terminal domain-containing protein [Bacteroidales bacterium]|nr:gliding motility-associated C-terminal domain-containing protein [Bacteroidales bacterium]
MKKIKNFFLLLVIILSANSVYGQPGCTGVTINTNNGADITLPCNQPCVTLNATAIQTSGQTATYTVSSIPYAPPFPFTGGTAIPITSDDDWSNVINIPNFHFCFFTIPYDNLIIGDNGVISFDVGDAGGYCPWSFTSGVPHDYGSPMNIFGAFHDTYLPAGGQMFYSVEGTTPCRSFVFKFNNVSQYSCNSLHTTQEIVLYETTNVIDVYINSKPLCSSWNGGNAVVGIQNMAQTVGYAAPGRNSGQWTGTNEAWRFTPVGTSYVEVYWFENGVAIGQGTSINVCPTANTTYTARASYSTCWGSVISVEDEINVILSGGSTSLSGDTVICTGDATILTASGSDTYVWAPGTGLNQTTGASVTASPTSTTTYTVTGTSATNNCTSSNIITVHVNPLPVLSVTPNGGNICIGDSISLTASGANTYVWSPDSTLSSSTDATVSAFPHATATYTITGTDTNQCVNSTTATVIASFGPAIIVTADPEHICPGDTSHLSVFGAAQIYTWSPGNTLTNTTGPTTNAFPLTTTTYSIVADNNGCISTAEIAVEVVPLPNVDFAASVREGCQGTVVSFTDLTTPAAAQWLWHFGDVIPFGNTSTQQHPVHYYEDAGSFDVSLSVVTNDGCKMKMTYPDFIVMHPNPSAYFEVKPEVASILDPLVFFHDLSLYADRWNWYFGDDVINNNSNLQNPTHVYADTGTYYPTLIVFTNFGCTDTITGKIIIQPYTTIYIPNAFTPNQDGKNPTFKAFGEGIDPERFYMNIYDRWGKLVFTTTDIETGWDGTVNGSVANEGLYVWYVSYYDALKHHHALKGNVVLIK